jgi:hypothetical protein
MHKTVLKYLKIGSVLEFQRWRVLKSKIFSKESSNFKEKKISQLMSARQKIGQDFSNKVDTRKNVFNEK